MTLLRAADVAELLLATAENGGSAAAVVVVGGSVDGLAGRRLAVVVDTPGASPRDSEASAPPRWTRRPPST
jgi:hypothetical protein